MNITEEAAKELLAIVRDSKAFVLDQAPDVAREIILWGTQSSILCIGISFVVLVLCFLVIRAAVLRDASGDIAVPAIMVGGIIGIVALSFFFDNVFELRKIKVAPKLYLLQTLKGMSQ